MTIEVSSGDLERAERAVSAGSLLQQDEALEMAKGAWESLLCKIEIAVLSAISHEYASVMAVFGEVKKMPDRHKVHGSVSYVVLDKDGASERLVALGGVTGQGIAQSAFTTGEIVTNYPFVKKIIMVGIAAGQPDLKDKERDVRLGDIVVGDKLIQYDHVKLTDGKREVRGDGIASADRDLLAVVKRLVAFQDFSSKKYYDAPWRRYIACGQEHVRSSQRPDSAMDPNSNGRNYVKGLQYNRRDDEPFIHVGTIGSASTLLKDEAFRDSLNKQYNTICYEMEGAGLAVVAAARRVGYLIVRGICDYGDIRKDDIWQTYASVCAAAFARAIIEEQS